MRALLRMEVCPICELPISVRKRPNCSLAIRMGAKGSKKKYGVDPESSAIERSKAIREFHAPICKTCRLPVDECKKRKIAKALKAHNDNPPVQEGPLGLYVPELNLTEAILSIECHPPNLSDINPIIPEWYKENE